jgi:transcriptional regulator with XRE-family HTH domain
MCVHEETIDMSREPSVRNRRIGMDLRKLREDRNLTLRAAGRLLERSPGSLSQIENGYGIRGRDLEYILDKYGVEDPLYRDALLELARTARSKSGWWHRYAGELSPAAMDFISLEAEANVVRAYQTILIPGLFQARAYAQALIEASNPDGADRAVEIRMTRQRIHERQDPPAVHAVVGQAALCQEVGGRGVMRDQLGRLIDLSKLDHVDLRVLPYAAGAHPGFSGPFTMVEIGQRGRLTVVMLETPDRMSYLEHPAEVRRYGDVFDRLCTKAMTRLESRAFIERIRSEL